MLILVLLGKHFDAVVVFVTSQTLLFRLALAISTVIDLRFHTGSGVNSHGRKIQIYANQKPFS